jgi:hypothetical protein
MASIFFTEIGGIAAECLSQDFGKGFKDKRGLVPPSPKKPHQGLLCFRCLENLLPEK